VRAAEGNSDTAKQQGSLVLGKHSLCHQTQRPPDHFTSEPVDHSINKETTYLLEPRNNFGTGAALLPREKKDASDMT